MTALEHCHTMIFGSVGLIPGYISMLKLHKNHLVRVFGDDAQVSAFYRSFSGGSNVQSLYASFPSLQKLSFLKNIFY